MQIATEAIDRLHTTAESHHRNLVVEVGRGSGPGQPKLYGTTMRFLQVLGLSSLDDLPPPGVAAETA